MKKKIISILSFVIICIGPVGYYFFKPPKVSIVMPVYNGAQYLERTIGFLLLSNYRDFEFVIIDDGSTDNSWEKLQEIAKQDRRIKLYQNEKNMGIVKTRNRGWQLARGEYIAPMDQDDLSLPERLELEVEYLDKHPDVALVDVGTISMAAYNKGISIPRVGAVSYLFKDDKAETQLLTLDERDENIKLSLFFSLAYPVQSGSMLRRSFFDKNHIKWPEGILVTDDYWMYAEMIEKEARFHHIDNIAHIYNDVRAHSDDFMKKRAEEVLGVKRKMFAWAGIDYEGYENLEVEEYMCRLFKDMLNLPDEKRKFSKSLLEKNQKLLCQAKE